MAIPLTPFERQFRDFGDAVKAGRRPSCSGEEGCRALELVHAIYQSCREGRKVVLDA
jgi:predicted dehydrogenase